MFQYLLFGYSGNFQKINDQLLSKKETNFFGGTCYSAMITMESVQEASSFILLKISLQISILVHMTIFYIIHLNIFVSLRIKRQAKYDLRSRINKALHEWQRCREIFGKHFYNMMDNGRPDWAPNWARLSPELDRKRWRDILCEISITVTITVRAGFN